MASAKTRSKQKLSDFTDLSPIVESEPRRAALPKAMDWAPGEVEQLPAPKPKALSDFSPLMLRPKSEPLPPPPASGDLLREAGRRWSPHAELRKEYQDTERSAAVDLAEPEVEMRRYPAGTPVELKPEQRLLVNPWTGERHVASPPDPLQIERAPRAKLDDFEHYPLRSTREADELVVTEGDTENELYVDEVGEKLRHYANRARNAKSPIDRKIAVKSFERYLSSEDVSGVTDPRAVQHVLRAYGTDISEDELVDYLRVEDEI